MYILSSVELFDSFQLPLTGIQLYQIVPEGSYRSSKSERCAQAFQISVNRFLMFFPSAGTQVFCKSFWTFLHICKTNDRRDGEREGKRAGWRKTFQQVNERKF